MNRDEKDILSDIGNAPAADDTTADTDAELMEKLFAGVTDDADVDRIVIVEVKHDYDDNTLIASIADKSEVTTLEDGRKAVSFTNTYNAGSATLDGDTYLEVTKKLTGRDWFDTDEFTFTLEATDDATRAVLPASAAVPVPRWSAFPPGCRYGPPPPPPHRCRTAHGCGGPPPV